MAYTMYINDNLRFNTKAQKKSLNLITILDKFT